MPDEFAVILEFAERHRMDIHGVRPIVARSQDWLPRVDLPDLDLVLVGGAHAFPVHGKHQRQNAVDLSLIDVAGGGFCVDGFCAACQRPARFGVRFTYSYEKTADGRPTPNWREHLTCPCGFSNRIRAAIQIVQRVVPRIPARP